MQYYDIGGFFIDYWMGDSMIDQWYFEEMFFGFFNGFGDSCGYFFSFVVVDVYVVFIVIYDDECCEVKVMVVLDYFGDVVNGYDVFEIFVLIVVVIVLVMMVVMVMMFIICIVIVVLGFIYCCLFVFCGLEVEIGFVGCIGQCGDLFVVLVFGFVEYDFGNVSSFGVFINDGVDVGCFCGFVFGYFVQFGFYSGS